MADLRGKPYIVSQVVEAFRLLILGPDMYTQDILTSTGNMDMNRESQGNTLKGG